MLFSFSCQICINFPMTWIRASSGSRHFHRFHWQSRKINTNPFFSLSHRLPDTKVPLPLVHILPITICAHTRRHTHSMLCRRTPQHTTQTWDTSYATYVHFVQQLIMAAEHEDRRFRSRFWVCSARELFLTSLILTQRRGQLMLQR